MLSQRQLNFISAINDIGFFPQWTSVDVLENMADKFKNISLESERHSEEMSKAGNNLLLGIGNVLDAASIPEAEEGTVQEVEEDSFEKNRSNFTKV